MARSIAHAGALNFVKMDAYWQPEPRLNRRGNGCNLFSGCLNWLIKNLCSLFALGRFDDIKAWIQGKKRSKVGHLASIFNAVATFLGHKRCL